MVCRGWMTGKLSGNRNGSRAPRRQCPKSGPLIRAIRAQIVPSAQAAIRYTEKRIFKTFSKTVCQQPRKSPKNRKEKRPDQIARTFFLR
jgi:hypothetical protein